jgi:uncharacterized repeat protein (TIGR03806 family)
MKKNYLLSLLLLILVFFSESCTNNDSDEDYQQISPVVLDVTQVPYPKLSDYKFFVGDLKNLEPAYKVLPYKPNSELFSDYAHKKRFIWMPEGSQATYDGDDNVLDFPVGTVMIKTFYYDDVLPDHTQKIIETRLLVKVSEEVTTVPADSGWKYYNYIWNEDQTEALLDTDGNGIFIPISFVENGVTKTTDYKVPANTECGTCHKINREETGEIVIPIGVKPQNLNFVYDYGTSQRNQLERWQAEGYLDNSIPDVINSIVDWRDASKSLELRARSYIEINCAHCHRLGGHCDYAAMRFNFSNSNLGTFGVCMEPSVVFQGMPYVINAGDANHSEMIYRMNATNQSVMMPLIGRRLVHEEGVALIKDWINSIPNPCQ